jgi:hypothetical protein
MLTGNLTVVGNIDSTTYSVSGDNGATGVFISADAKTITVKAGLITNIA